MANRKHLAILKKGVKDWNEWRQNNPDEEPDLSNTTLWRASLHNYNLKRANLRNSKLAFADFEYADLTMADLSNTDLENANFCYATLMDADLSRANLRKAGFIGATLNRCNLTETNLTKANFLSANLSFVDLSNSKLTDVEFEKAILVGTNFANANLINCKIYGIAAWDIKLDETIQKDLIITPSNEKSIIKLDSLEVAQFIYLILHNEKIPYIIDTITTKVVLILGRFTKERKKVLDAIRQRLKEHDYIPVIFDFNDSLRRDTQETITTLARMAKFIIADITSPKSIPQELVSIVEGLPSVPVIPLLKGKSKPWGMFDHIKRYPWVLAVYRYKDLGDLIKNLREKVIIPAETRVVEVKKVKAEASGSPRP